MDKMELQNTAERVVDLEARITSWTGTLSQWIKELSPLHETVEMLILAALDSNDPVEKSFVQCLQLKTDKCREHVLKRMDMRIGAGFFRSGY